MGSMHIGLEEAESGFERMAAFYAARARGGVGLIVTGGIAPNDAGRPYEGGAKLTTEAEAGAAPDRHRRRARARAAGSRCRSCTSAGTPTTPDLVAPSALQAPISPFTPHALTDDEVEQTIEDYRAGRASWRSRRATTASRSWAPRAT